MTALIMGRDTPTSSTGDLTQARSERRIDVLANRIDARALFSGTREIQIAHGDDLYRLRLTSQNKLILTK